MQQWGNVLAHGCRFLGGSSCFIQGTGATGVNITSGSLVLRDCIAMGGGGAVGSGGSMPAGVGGPGIAIDGGASVWSIGSQLLGGVPASLFFPYFPGAPSTIVSGTLQEASADAATLTTSPLLLVNATTGGAAATLALETTPAASTLLIASIGTSPAFAPGLPGFLGTALDQVAIAGGTTDMFGRLDVAITIVVRS